MNQSNAYASTLQSITKIPQQLITILTGKDVVNCLRTQDLLDLNELPFKFSEEKNHVWQVLEALETILNNNYYSFSQVNNKDKLTEINFGKYVSLANDLKKEEKLINQIWIVVFLHDIAKYSVQNADHAQISGNLVADLFKTNNFGLEGHEQERIVWVIGNHDVVGNIVSSAERAPWFLTERLEKLSYEEKQTRLNMLILLSLCDLRGTSNGSFVNNYQAESRFWAADLYWLEKKEIDLFEWRKERLVRASTKDKTDKKRYDWNKVFDDLSEETQQTIKNQFGKNIKVFTNLLYLALGLNGEESAKLFTVISLMAEKAADEKSNPNFQVDFTKGAERDGQGPIINTFKSLLIKINRDDLTLSKIKENFIDQNIYGIPISINKDNLTIDSNF